MKYKKSLSGFEDYLLDFIIEESTSHTISVTVPGKHNLSQLMEFAVREPHA